MISFEFNIDYNRSDLVNSLKVNPSPAPAPASEGKGAAAQSEGSKLCYNGNQCRPAVRMPDHRACRRHNLQPQRRWPSGDGRWSLSRNPWPSAPARAARPHTTGCNNATVRQSRATR